MKTYTVYVSTRYVVSGRTETFEVEDNATEGEIEEAATDVLWNLIGWGFYEGEPKKGRWD